jgi:hypothetical protein
MSDHHDNSSVTRRQVLAGAGGTGLLAAAAPIAGLGTQRPQRAARPAVRRASGDGTPERRKFETFTLVRPRCDRQ